MTAPPPGADSGGGARPPALCGSAMPGSPKGSAIARMRPERLSAPTCSSGREERRPLVARELRGEGRLPDAPPAVDDRRPERARGVGALQAPTSAASRRTRCPTSGRPTWTQPRGPSWSGPTAKRPARGSGGSPKRPPPVGPHASYLRVALMQPTTSISGSITFPS